MNEDTTVIPFRHADSIDDPLTELAREGARRMLAEALKAEADAFVASFADDLLPERRAALLEWLDTEVGSRPPNLRWRDVRALLRDWPTPGHTDDKTLAVVRTAQ